MKIALLGDVHANLHALEAVLAHARLQGAGAIWNIGDFVGYGAFPDEVVTRLRQENALSILRNYDHKVLEVEKKRQKWEQTKHPLRLLAFQWAFDHLGVENRRYLAALPEEIRLSVEGWNILLAHASPASKKEHLVPETPDTRFCELAEIARADIVICGHSHRQFTRQAGDTLFINTGSVGRPDNGDPRAVYAILELEPGGIQVIHHLVDYDVEQAAQAILKAGLPAQFAEMIRQGRNLDEVQPEENDHA